MIVAAERHQIPIRGICYMLATTLVMFPALNASVKFLATDYSLVQIIFVRSIVHLGWMLVFFMPGMGFKLFATNCLGLQLARSLLQLLALVAFVVGLLYVPMTTATSIYFSGPLIVVALAALLLGGPWIYHVGLAALARGVDRLSRRYGYYSTGRGGHPLGGAFAARLRFLLRTLSSADPTHRRS